MAHQLAVLVDVEDLTRGYERPLYEYDEKSTRTQAAKYGRGIAAQVSAMLKPTDKDAAESRTSFALLLAA